MNLLEFNKIIGGKFMESSKPKEYEGITMDELEEFRSFLAIDDSMVTALRETGSAAEFYSAYPVLDALEYSKAKKEDLFYAAKLGYFYTGVPSKLVYLLAKTLNSSESPNIALAKLKDQASFAKFLVKGSMQDGISIKKVMTNILNKEFRLLSAANRKIKCDNFYEIYVENVDRVLLIPESMAKDLDSMNDLKAVKYEKGLGVCVYDMPIRTLGGRIGVVTNEFDLRDVI